jgi:hypothetical protein
VEEVEVRPEAKEGGAGCNLSPKRERKREILPYPEFRVYSLAAVSGRGRK